MSLAEEILKIKSDVQALKKFGYTMIAGFLVISGIIFWKHHVLSPWCFGLAFLTLVLTAAAPIALLPFQKIWMALALCLGWLMARIFLTLFFYAFLTPYSWIARISGKKFLNCDIEPEKPSYWDKHEQLIPDKTRYENQF